jgi:hypothetical protein
MSGYYPPNQNLPPQYYHLNPNYVPNHSNPHAPQQAPPHLMTSDGSYSHAMPESPLYQSMPGAYVPYPDVPLQQNYIGQYEDASGPMDHAQNSNARVRRRSGPGDQVKHRRTRSGCYTCRQRRVKVSSSTINSKPKTTFRLTLAISVMSRALCVNVSFVVYFSCLMVSQN